MGIPLKVRNRLLLGRDVAAQIHPTSEYARAWIYVYPIVDSRFACRSYVNSNEGRIVINGDNQRAILCFLVRILDIADEIADRHDRSVYYDPDDVGDPNIDSISFPRNEVQLESLLKRYLDDLSALHIPSDVGYHFEGGAALAETVLEILNLNSSGADR